MCSWEARFWQMIMIMTIFSMLHCPDLKWLCLCRVSMLCPLLQWSMDHGPQSRGLLHSAFRRVMTPLRDFDSSICTCGYNHEHCGSGNHAHYRIRRPPSPRIAMRLSEMRARKSLMLSKLQAAAMLCVGVPPIVCHARSDHMCTVVHAGTCCECAKSFPKDSSYRLHDPVSGR